MKKFLKKGTALVAFPLSALSLAISGSIYAQEAEQDAPEQEQTSSEERSAPPKRRVVLANPIEEVLVLGRIQSAAGDIVLERMEQEVAVDLISAELISRIGDSNVATALRRVPGVTLVDDKFVFVRGLGERYSSTTLNGANIPSPDLTRNVVPLDIFPTSIVETLSVQKVASADMAAAFGGGAVDIRTNGLPDDFLFFAEIGIGDNSNSGDFFTYNGGGDDRLGKDDGTRALTPTLSSALNRYRGNFRNIAEFDGISEAEAQEDVRNLALELNRDITIFENPEELDRSFQVNVGNTFGVTDEAEIGFLAGISYNSSWRNTETTFVLSDDLIPGTDIAQDQAFEKESTFNVSLTGNFSLGFRLNEENTVETTTVYIRNTDDETTIEDNFNTDNPITSGTSDRSYNLRYEQRELLVNQIHGEHELGFATRELLGLDFLESLDGLKFSWYFSDSESTTEIPNEIRVNGQAGFIRPFSLETNASTVQTNLSAADYRFTDLEDHLESAGWELAYPIELTNFSIELSGGAEYWRKARTYRQLQFGLGSNVQSSPNVGQPGEVFTNANILNPDFGFQINVNNANADSYVAANKVSAAYGKFDVTWQDTWRVAAGLRWEDYQQVGLSWDPLDFDGSPLIPDAIEARAYDNTLRPDGVRSNVIADFFESATFADNDIFTSVALTYMTPNFFAEDFQLRLGFSETTVRPDLREITESSYIDPITDFLVFGESSLVPAQFKNYDIRAEWYFEDGDNLTLSLFYKDITDPIDVQEVPRSEDDRAVSIFNAESAEITGIEVELLKSLGNVSDLLEPFFIQGNFTVLDTNTVAGSRALNPTNPERDLVGASNAANLIFGFDSDDGKHAATMSYNWFGERLFFAGRAGQADVFEQPSNTLDMTYSYFPTDNLIFKLKAKNILDETVSFKRENESFTLLEEERGVNFSMSATLTF
ncbi:TonB-dependent receptor domain-containing protein [Agarilytica rhodophyticola]|uniref:TonB-dependent receptor domain-containing protein n=1 Tax=Agarilytica rhodophyticola TaxID=1737490 RepID=UPI000B341394|nr:TonB-dependent receptor [Agarilytica rhodophyticola]